MKITTLFFLTIFFALISFVSTSQISLATLQKLATLNLSVESFGDVLRSQGYKNSGNGEWIKKTSNNRSEVVKVIVTSDGNQISYKSFNIPQIKGTVDAIRKLGREVFTDNERNQIHFRRIDEKHSYEVLYSEGYNLCSIVIFPYKEPVESESEKPKVVEKTTVAVEIVKQAEYVGGHSEMVKFINKNLEVPEDASNWEGNLVVRFFIEKDGSVQDVSIPKSGKTLTLPDSLIEAIKLTFKKMPKWKPALDSNGNAVRSYQTLPLRF